MTPINIDSLKVIPPGFNLVIFEEGQPNPTTVLYGFDEIEVFSRLFNNPAFGLEPIG